MRAIRFTILVVACVLFANSVVAAQQEGDQPRRNNDRVLDNLFRLPPGAKLTDEQKEKLDALRKEKGPERVAKLAELQKKMLAIYTQEQRDARQQAFRAARDAGKDAREAQKAGNDAVELSKEQQVELDKARREQQGILLATRKDINAILGRTNDRPARGPRIKPTEANVKYGPHERNVLDFWKSESDKPTPVLVSIHGGGFRGGNKSVASSLLQQCLDEGISVVAITYRFSQHAIAPASFTDSARAIQFVRSKAKEWNLDPERFASTGGSAGAGISLWLGFHDDMADPNNDDPVSGSRRASRACSSATARRRTTRVSFASCSKKQILTNTQRWPNCTASI